MKNAIEIEGLEKKFDLPLKPPGGIFSVLPKHFVSRKYYRDFRALRGVDLVVPKGRMLGIIGLNGSGKSTLLKIMAGILSPTSGKVRTEGLVAALLELGAGFHEELSGMENIFLNGAILGLSRKEILDRLPSIIEFSGLGKFIDTPIKRYSSGMKARLGFSVAANVDPDILLIDEVISVGDLEFQSKCIGRIGEFREQNKTILMVTHEVDAANYLCDDLLWLQKGKVRQFGPASEVAHNYRAFTHARVEGKEEDEENRQLPSIFNFDVITGVEFLEGEGGQRKSFRTNEPLTLQIRYDCRAQVLERTEIELKVYRRDNVVIINQKSTECGFIPGDLQNSGVIYIHLDPLLLLLGKYEISVKLYDADNPEKIYAHRHRKDGFEVTTQRLHNPGIVADVPCEWKLEAENAKA